MSPTRPEDLFVGLVALALMSLIARRILRGLRSGRLPIYRSYLSREESGAKFSLLLALHALTLLLAAWIAFDLLVDL
jgi:hypothetical protein